MQLTEPAIARTPRRVVAAGLAALAASIVLCWPSPEGVDGGDAADRPPSSVEILGRGLPGGP